MPTNLYVSAPLRDKPVGVVTTIAFNPLYGDIDPARMARSMMIEAITKAVVAGADYREMVLCDNFYTPRVRPETAWDLRLMVETIADFSVEIGVPFISGKDSSSGTFQAGEKKIDVPPTLAVAAVGRVPDVKKIVTKEFKRAGNRLLLVGRFDPSVLGGSVYADCYGQRGDCLFDAGETSAIRAAWDALLRAHSEGRYVAGGAIAEGGILLRAFEAAWGGGLGARINLDVVRNGRRDGFLFGEFIGSVMLEVPPSCDLEQTFSGIPYVVIGEVIEEPKLRLVEKGKLVWEDSVARLAEGWSRTFHEVVE